MSLIEQNTIEKNAIEQDNFQKKLENDISFLKKSLGEYNAKENLRRFVYNLGNYEYSGFDSSIKSKLLITAEIINSVFKFCSDSNKDIQQLLHNIFSVNFILYSSDTNKNTHELNLSYNIKALDKNNNFLLFLVKSKENYFSLIIEKLDQELNNEQIKDICHLVTSFFKEELPKKEIYRRLYVALKYIESCPIKIYCIDRHILSHKGVFTASVKECNFDVFNFHNGKKATKNLNVSNLPNNKIVNFFSFNIIYAISYIVSKKGALIDLKNKKIVYDLPATEDLFEINTKNLIKYTVNRFVSDDKYVLGLLDRRTSLNYRLKNAPEEVKQINLGEIDEDGLNGLKAFSTEKLKATKQLKKLTKKINDKGFEFFIANNYEKIPLLILEQEKLLRSKLLFNKAKKIFHSHTYDLAINMFEDVLSLDKKFTEARLLKSIAHYNLQEYPLAIEELSCVIANNKNNMEALHYRGMCYAQQKELIKATEDFNTIILLEEKKL